MGGVAPRPALAFNVPVSKTIQISRRTFVKDCATIAAATGLPLWFVQRELEAAQQQAPAVTSPNDRPGIALIGCGGMGTGDIKSAARFGDVVALCDVDDSHAAAVAKNFTKDGKAPTLFTDFRKVLERKDVNIIVQATPDHWHTLINLAAASAKKDIYGEKPLTLTIDEGKHLVKAVRKEGIILQTGTQQRSHKLFRLACELVRNGRIGTLKTVSVFVPAGLREGPFTPVPVPPEFHWDMWLGQAPKVEYLKERCHATFRWWWDYSGGPVTDWGAHHNDIARWAIGLDGPISIEAKAPIEPIPGGYTTPPEFEATLMWANGVTQIVKTTKDDSPFGAIINPAGQRNGVRLEGHQRVDLGQPQHHRSERSGNARYADGKPGGQARGQRRSHGQLHRRGEVAKGSDQPGRGRPPIRRRRSPDRHRAANRQVPQVGSGCRALRRRACR